MRERGEVGGEAKEIVNTGDIHIKKTIFGNVKIR